MPDYRVIFFFSLSLLIDKYHLQRMEKDERTSERTTSKYFMCLITTLSNAVYHTVVQQPHYIEIHQKCCPATSILVNIVKTSLG